MTTMTTITIAVTTMMTIPIDAVFFGVRLKNQK